MTDCKHNWHFYESMKALKCTRCGKTTTPEASEADKAEVPHAFPNPHRTDLTGTPLRDYFAAQAMNAFLSRDGSTLENDAEYAYKMADAMMKAREA